MTAITTQTSASLSIRRASLRAGSFLVNEAHLDAWTALFERPTPDEPAE